jgi:predicted nucleotidyltransferase
MFGLTLDQFEILKTLVLKPLKERKAKVFVFGSRARGTHHVFSDIDILFEENLNNPISLVELSLIKENIENSNLTI